jgi:protein-tyrosine phosphatase
VFFFGKKNKPSKDPSPLICDVHSHLIWGIDDGVKTEEEALATIQILMEMGYRKIITTPHIHHDIYPNEIITITEGKERLRNLLASKHINLSLDCAAEYYFDQWFYNEVDQEKPLLTFGNQYLLFETNYLTEPYQLKSLIFKLITSGYKPVLAHPERYQYMTIEKAEDLRTRGVCLQLNLLSLLGYYGKSIQSMAQKLIDQKLIDLAGSDCHNQEHAKLLSTVSSNKYFKKLVELPLLNFQL